jgi:dTDP-6-deoxy-L-talose 4-dehydrogenase (NAD+)
VVELDLASPATSPFELLGRPDTLIHLAWGGLPNYASDIHLAVELPRQRHFLEACLRGGLRHLVVTGTCLEYGLQEGEWFEDAPIRPHLAYGQAKAALCEDLLKLRAELGFGLAWSRVFYLFGSGQAPTSLHAQLNAAMDRGDHRFPMSAGDQVRDFLPIESAADALVELALRRADPGVVNLCSGVPITVLALVMRWVAEKKAGIALDTGHFPYPSYEPFSFWGSRAKLDNLLESA